MEQQSIAALAESSIREAEGDWKRAKGLFESQLDASPDLKVSLFTSAMEQELRRAASSLGLQTRACPSCQEIIPVDAERCHYCGEALDRVAANRAVAAATAERTSGPLIRHFTLFTGWVLFLIVLILLFALQG